MNLDGYYYNNASMRFRQDGTLVILVDRIYGCNENLDKSQIVMYTSSDNGQSWDGGRELPIFGIVPDRLLECSNGRWIIACHHQNQQTKLLEQRLWYSDDRGQNWTGPVIVGRLDGLNLCEASIIEVDGRLVCLMRENSWLGHPAYRAISDDFGKSWSIPEPVPLLGCHRPRSGYLKDGRIFITYRFVQGGYLTTQNLFGALTTKKLLTETTWHQIGFRILPLDYDPSHFADTGYSGWVELDDGSLYVVNYLKGQTGRQYIHGFTVPAEDLTVYGIEDEDWK